MIYLVDVNAGSDVPFSQMAYMVDNAINEGQYTHQYGQTDSAESAITALDNAIDTSDWRKITYCYNNNPSPVLTEILRPVIDGYTNSKALNTAHTGNGSDVFSGIINEKTFPNTVNGWSSAGAARIMGGTPVENSISIDLNTQYVQWAFQVFSTLSVTDNRFTLDEQQVVMTYSMSIRRIRADLWEWHAGQNTGTRYIPEEWLILNGTDADNTDNDPYSDDSDDSTSGGNDGDQDNWGDDTEPNPEPTLPSLEATDAGFIQLFCPTVSQLKALANYMWSNLFDLATFKRLFADPMDCILGLSLVPCNVSGSAGTVNVGNINTGVSMNKASSQYKTIDCGSIDVHEKLKSYLDYSPYRKFYLFLPYIGTKELDIDMLNGATLGVKYHVDVLTGGCTAFILVNGNVVENYSGQCSMNVPITSRDWSNTINGILSLASSAAGAAVSGGLSAPVTAASVAGAVTSSANLADTVMNSKPSYEKSGGLSSSPGILGNQKPFLLLERPRICKPAKQNMYTGYPGFITKKLGGVSGFTQVQNIRLNNFSATESERNEILRLLREGVIL